VQLAYNLQELSYSALHKIEANGTRYIKKHQAKTMVYDDNETTNRNVRGAITTF